MAPDSFQRSSCSACAAKSWKAASPGRPKWYLSFVSCDAHLVRVKVRVRVRVRVRARVRVRVKVRVRVRVGVALTLACHSVTLTLASFVAAPRTGR